LYSKFPEVTYSKCLLLDVKHWSEINVLLLLLVGFAFRFTTIKIVRIKHILMSDLPSCSPGEHK
jgi:hypothetical protein